MPGQSMIWVDCMRLKNKPWARPFIASHPDLVLDQASFLAHLAKTRGTIMLEVGSGKGNFLISMASKRTDVMFYGIERALVAAAICGRKLTETPLENVKFVNADFGQLVELLPHAVFDAIFLNFSDPWPKKRHAKRRLTSPRYLKHYLRILAPAGQIFVKTDNRELYEYSLTTMREHDYNIVMHTEDYQILDEFDALTEYEETFRSKGEKIYRIVIRKE